MNLLAILQTIIVLKYVLRNHNMPDIYGTYTLQSFPFEKLHSKACDTRQNMHWTNTYLQPVRFMITHTQKKIHDHIPWSSGLEAYVHKNISVLGHLWQSSG